MAEKLERKVMEIYGENAATRDIIAYGSDIAGNIVETKDPDVIQTEAYKTGVRSAVVGNNSTTLQNRQALDFLFSRQLKYLYQHGIAEWGADETYFVNSLAVGSNGNLYVSLTDNNKGNDPVTDTTNWQAFPTPAQLAQKVAKAGDTMTGTLKMSGSNEVRFGTDSSYYYIKNDTNSGNFLIYNNNGKGLFLQTGEANAPFYWDGTNGYRLLTTADLESLQTQINSLNTEVTGMLGRMNFSAAVQGQVGNGYTVPSKGYVFLTAIAGSNGSSATAYINGAEVISAVQATTGADVETIMVPVSPGDVVTQAGQKGSVSYTFVPQV